jgi:hypothetical protein
VGGSEAADEPNETDESVSSAMVDSRLLDLILMLYAVRSKSVPAILSPFFVTSTTGEPIRRAPEVAASPLGLLEVVSLERGAGLLFWASPAETANSIKISAAIIDFIIPTD